MAKFLKIHHENHYGDIEKYTVNLEAIVDVDEENHDIYMTDGDIMHVARDNEWEKIMSFVKSNEL